MKFIKGLLTAVVILVALVVLISVFLPSEYEVTRKIEIKASTEKVYNDVLDLNNWGDWAPRQKMDPDVVNTFEGAAGVGQINSWESEVIGNGTQKITVAEPNTTIESLLEFEGNKGGTGFFLFSEVAEGTEITWGFKGENPFYMRIMALVMDKMLGGQFETALADLKTRIESMPDVPAIEIEEIEAMYFMSSKASIAVEEITATLGNLYGGLTAHFAANEIEMAGMPMCFYHTRDHKTTDLEAALPVAEGKHPTTETITYGIMDAGKVVSVTYTGSYEHVAAVHESIGAFIEKNGLEMRGASLEIYVNDPTLVEPDQIVTKIIYPIMG